jgi:hypothetical protein
VEGANELYELLGGVVGDFPVRQAPELRSLK